MKDNPITPSRLRRWGSLMLISALLFAVLATLTFAHAATPKAHAASASPKVVIGPSVAGLHVSGNLLENSSGQVVQLRGVNRSGSEYMCTKAASGAVFDGPSDQTSINAMTSWDINVVRVPLNEDCWLGINGEPAAGYSSATYQQNIVNYVNLLIGSGLDVILDLHWTAPGTQQSLSQEAMPDLTHASTFWSSVARTFSSQSGRVIFDLFNEPFPLSWSCLQSGSTVASKSPCADVPFAAASLPSLITAVRNTGAANVIMIAGTSYANAIGTLDAATSETLLTSDPNHNLVASLHYYNFDGFNSLSYLESTVVKIAGIVPVIIGELGENDCTSTFINMVMAFADQYNVSYLGWAWDTYNCGSFPALISNYNGTPTAFGAGFRQHLLDLATFTLAADSCGYNTALLSQSSTGYVLQLYLANFTVSVVGHWTVAFPLPQSESFSGITIDPDTLDYPSLTTSVLPIGGSSQNTLVISAATSMGSSSFDLLDISISYIIPQLPGPVLTGGVYICGS